MAVGSRPLEGAIREELEALRIDRAARSPRRAPIWILVLVGVGALAVPLAVGAWWLASRERPVVRTATVRERPASRAATVLNGSGYVTARRRATVSSKVTGKLVEVRVEEGMPVQEGQLLARLDPAQALAVVKLAESRLEVARRAVDETEVQLELAQLTLERTRRLVDEEIAGQAELDAARTGAEALRARLRLEREQIRAAESEVAVSRTDLDDTRILAPFDGIVISKDAQPGETVSPVSAGGGFTRTGICTLVDMDSLEIEVDVNESYISRVEPGQPVEATLDAYPDWRIPAHVITTIPAADRQKATVLVRIGFDALDSRILPDMGVKVAFQEASAPESDGRTGLVLPRDAIRHADGREVVYVVRDGLIERRAVALGGGSDDEVEVLSGLAAGEVVVVEGPDGLADGDRVSVGSPAQARGEQR